MTDTIGQMVAVCSTSKNPTKLKTSLSEFKTRFDLVEPALRLSRHHAKVRKSLVSISNSVAGLLVGLEGKEITLGEFRSVIRNIDEKFVPKYKDELEALAGRDARRKAEAAEDEGQEPKSEVISIDAARIKAKLKSTSNTNWKDVLKVIKERPEQEVDTPEATNLSDDELIRKLGDLRQLRSTVPQRLRSDYEMFHLPVVPILAQSESVKHGRLSVSVKANESFFRDIGIRAVYINQGYFVLENQLCLAISRSKANLVQTKKDRTGGALAYAEAVLDIIRDTTGQTYKVVSETFVANSRNSDIIFYWIMNSRRLTALTKRVGKIEHWGFPWD